MEKHPRFNTSTAAYAHVRYTGASAATKISSLSYYYRGRVTFSLPDPISPSGQVLLGAVSVVVYDDIDAVVFNSSAAKIVGNSREDRCVTVRSTVQHCPVPCTVSWAL